MKKFAADNLMFLREQYPQIYKYIRNRKPDTEKFQVSQAKNGEPILTYVPEEGAPIAMNSRYNPTHEAQVWAESIADSVKKNNDVLICGLGFGYHLAAVLEAYPDKLVYIYEPHIDVFLLAIECQDLRGLLSHKNIAMFAVGNDLQTQLELLEPLFNTITGALATSTLPAYRTAFPSIVKEFSQTVLKTAEAVATTYRTIEKFRHHWIVNMILNMEYNLQSVSFKGMKDSCKGVTAILVGSGPSLGMEIENIRKLKNNKSVIIIAAGSSIQSLQNHGIDPDLAVTMDPGAMNAYVFEKMNIEHVPMLYIPSVHHMILRKNCRHRMHAFFLLDTPVNYMMNVSVNDPIFQNTGTVSGTAIQAAIYLGCTEIVFVGQDFSFPDNKYYADGVSHARDEILESKVNAAKEFVPNVNGGMNRTSEIMNVLRRGIEQFLDLYPQYSFYNASRIGAVIEHTEPKTLDEVIAEHQDYERESNWFIRLMESATSPYTSEQIESIVKRMQLVNRKAIEYDQAIIRIRLILEDMNDAILVQSDVRAEKCLIEFEQIWSQMLDDATFKQIYGFFLLRELNYAYRHWPDMEQEQNMILKTRKLIELLQPMMGRWDEVSTRMLEMLALLDQRWEYSLIGSEN